MATNLDATLVIDADGHVNEGDVDLKPYLPEKWRAQAPVRLRDNKGHMRMLLEGRIWPTADGPGPGGTGALPDQAGKTRPGMTNAQARLDDMDLEGIDVAILFGTQVALTVNGLMNGEFAAALCRAVNQALLEYCAADPARLKAVGLIPCQSEERRVGEESKY